VLVVGQCGKQMVDGAGFGSDASYQIDLDTQCELLPSVILKPSEYQYCFIVFGQIPAGIIPLKRKRLKCRIQ